MMSVEEKRGYVRRFFPGTGSSYDRIVSVCTFGVDQGWKRRIVAKLNHPLRVLDLACGTGILTLEIARRYPDCQIVGVDVTASYLQQAREKARRLGQGQIRFEQGWAEEFGSEAPFDAILSSYLAKYADLPVLVQRTSRMLNAGGLLLFHDFTYPKNRVLSSAWELHFKFLQTFASRIYPQWREVFCELPGLIRRTRWVEELVDVLRENGLIQIEVEPLTLQGATLVSARKPLP